MGDKIEKAVDRLLNEGTSGTYYALLAVKHGESLSYARTIVDGPNLTLAFRKALEDFKVNDFSWALTWDPSPNSRVGYSTKSAWGKMLVVVAKYEDRLWYEAAKAISQKFGVRVSQDELVSEVE